MTDEDYRPRIDPETVDRMTQAGYLKHGDSIDQSINKMLDELKDCPRHGKDK